MSAARDRRMQGGYIPTVLYLDAKSVFAAVTATFIKQPAEKSLLSHVHYLRELLDKGIIQGLIWIDTRDMGADGLTKGAVARDALHELMAGAMHLRHEWELWRSKLSGSPSAEAQPCLFRSSKVLFTFNFLPIKQQDLGSLAMTSDSTLAISSFGS